MKEVLLDVLKQSVANFAVDQVGVSRWVSSQPGFAKRSLARGFTWYISRELVEEATMGESNFRHMNSLDGWKNLLDDSVFYGVAGGVAETFQLFRPLEDVTKSVVGNNEFAGNLAEGALIVGSKYLGDYIVDNGIAPGLRNVSSMLNL